MQKIRIGRLDQNGVQVLTLTNQTNYFMTEYSERTYEEALERIKNIRSDVNKIINKQSLNLNQANMINTLFKVDEIFTGEIQSVEVNKKGNFENFKETSGTKKHEPDGQPDTTDMPKLEDEESAAERRNQ